VFQALCAHRQEVKIVLTASGVITPIGGRPVHRLREECLVSFGPVSRLNVTTIEPEV